MDGTNRRFGTGFLPDPPDARDHAFMPPPRAGKLPPIADLSPRYPTALDQGLCNTCTSNATANALLFLVRSLGLAAEPQSRLFIYWNGRKLSGAPVEADPGLNIRDAMKAVAQFHSVPETAWPYDVPTRIFVEPDVEARRLSQAPETFSYEKVDQTESAVKQAIAAGHPVILGILLRDSFHNVGADGVCVMTGPEAGWHAVAIVGYNDETRRFKLQNSWGTQWGANGFFELDYAYVTDPATASDLWTVTLFRDAPDEPAIVMTIHHAGKSLAVPPVSAPAGSPVVLGAETSWEMAPVGPDTYTLRPKGDSLFVSCRADGVVETSPAATHWTFTSINDKLRVFTISVAGAPPLTAPDAKFLTVGRAGNLTLQRRLPPGQGAANQQFTVK